MSPLERKDHEFLHLEIVKEPRWEPQRRGRKPHFTPPPSPDSRSGHADIDQLVRSSWTRNGTMESCRIQMAHLADGERLRQLPMMKARSRLRVLLSTGR